MCFIKYINQIDKDWMKKTFVRGLRSSDNEWAESWSNKYEVLILIGVNAEMKELGTENDQNT